MLAAERGIVFAAARTKALAEQDRASIGMMEVLLKNLVGKMPPWEQKGWGKQSEQEFGIRMRDFRRAARERGRWMPSS